jgi:hypothetical protein
LSHGCGELTTNRFIMNAGIDQGFVNILMAQEFLQGGDGHAIIDQKGGQSMAQAMRREGRNLSQGTEALKPISDELMLEGCATIDQQVIGGRGFPDNQISLEYADEVFGHGDDPIAVAFAALDAQTPTVQIKIGQAQILDFALAQTGMG